MLTSFTIAGNDNLLYALVVILVAYVITGLITACLIMLCRKFFIVRLVFFISIIFLGLFSTFALFGINKFMVAFYLFGGILFLFLAITTNSSDKDDFKILVYLPTFFIYFSSSVLVSDWAIKILEFGNIDYKFITIEKKYKDILPHSVCKKDCDKLFCVGKNGGAYGCGKNISVISYLDTNLTIKYDDNGSTNILQNIPSHYLSFIDKDGDEIKLGKTKIKLLNFDNGTLIFANPDKKQEQNVTVKSKFTYIEENSENNDTIRIYNLKALSILGKFYYLKTRSGETFELDSSLIKSKQKAD